VNMARHICYMKKDRRPQESNSLIEALRIKQTNLSQTEFAVKCGIPLRTYQRWIYGETEAKLTPTQWKAMIKLLDIQSFEDIPDDFGPVNQEEE
ncbi:MAG: helix-turn-helix transcriptional regulator, partial [Spirulinaceae cyanobacterium]